MAEIQGYWSTPRGYGRTADIFAWGERQILKLFHEGWEIGSGQEEARIGGLVHDSGIPVPNVLGTVEDKGRYGVIYERVDGYMGRYLKSGAISRRAIDEWEIPVAVDRLATGIPEERTKLLALIERLMHRS